MYASESISPPIAWTSAKIGRFTRDEVELFREARCIFWRSCFVFDVVDIIANDESAVVTASSA